MSESEFGDVELVDERVSVDVPEGTEAIAGKDINGNVVLMPLSDYAEWERDQDKLRK